ncbi:MAG TPA: adenylate/guanylate cyclase domain-containing protein [Spirochaetota bacterium]|nr:MAG: Adenylate and Guanylate cyclase catalytic domain protein [Spirochaetes bacterium ADurb.Bin133]HNZ26727.1 adenylate/guanylate cyclase domain-containing protein [Spirochaetota bacterium]HPY86862.1 adenylate/guanylate cyclase domain-containing protein [Spirochaetota bacterium]HQB61444.1 adenylate/guanylate cyclase domain-containing protein [Spirochaetota bacterium]
MGKALKFEKEISAIYIFCDIRDFSKKIKESSDEMKKILEVYYSLALKVFGKFGSKTREDGTFKKIVKFIGDGFFCVNEYTDRLDLINRKMDESIKDISNFDKKFKETITNLGLSEISLPINLGFGINYGLSSKIDINKYHTEYIGNIINVSSRLCDAAKPSGIIIRKTDDIENFINEKSLKDSFEHDYCDIKNGDKVEVYIAREINFKNL